MTRKKKFRPQKTFKTVTDAMDFKAIEPGYSDGTFIINIRIWKKVRGQCSRDIHDIEAHALTKYELLRLHRQIQEAIKKDLNQSVEMAKRFGVTL